MGYRGHVRKCNKIEYGVGRGNNDYDKFREILEVLSEDDLEGLLEYCAVFCDGYYAYWEIDADEYKEILKRLNESETYEKMKHIIASEDEWKDICDVLRSWYEEADKTYGNIYIDWF